MAGHFTGRKNINLSSQQKIAGRGKQPKSDTRTFRQIKRKFPSLQMAVFCVSGRLETTVGLIPNTVIVALPYVFLIIVP